METKPGEIVRIAVGSRWRRNKAGIGGRYIGRYTGEAVVVVLAPLTISGQVQYRHETGNHIVNRESEKFREFFDLIPAGHDLSNPYLCKPPMVICMTCAQMWDFTIDPEPPVCTPGASSEPIQVRIDRAQADALKSAEERTADYRKLARRIRRSFLFPRDYEPSRNGLGAGIVGRWPW